METIAAAAATCLATERSEAVTVAAVAEALAVAIGDNPSVCSEPGASEGATVSESLNAMETVTATVVTPVAPTGEPTSPTMHRSEQEVAPPLGEGPPHVPATATTSSTQLSTSCPEPVPAVQSSGQEVTGAPEPEHPPTPGTAPPALLLDPLLGASHGPSSSLSPSPRATLSPPKHALFSPCVDVFEPTPPSWQGGREEEEEEEEEVGADESQYRHRRLTGDSGIEVCRCRVDEDDEEEEEEDEEEGEDEKESPSVGGGESAKRGSDVTELHDSADCPARGQVTEGNSAHDSTTTAMPPPSEVSSDVVIVVETV